MRKRITPTLAVEAGVLVSDVRAVVARSAARARSLATLGESMDQTVSELFHDAEAPELRSAATQLQATAHFAVSLALELAVHAGELQQIASLYEATGANDRDR